MHARSTSVLALTLLLSPTAAFAGGFYVSDIGTRALARGGAFVASPDSVLAMHYNPAGLSLLRGLHTELSVQLVSMNAKFQRSCPCVDPALGSLDDDTALQSIYDANPVESNTPIAIPFLGIAYGLPWLDLTIGAGVWGPTSGRFDWGSPPDPNRPSFAQDSIAQPQRYSGIQMRNIEVNFALAVGMRPLPSLLPGLRIGAAAMGYQSGNNQSLHLFVNSPTLANGPEDPELDVPVVLQFRENFKLNWAVGASYEIIEGLSLGSSFRGKRSIRAPGTLTVGLPERLQGVVSLNGRDGTDGRPLVGDIEAELNTAPIWRTGVQYKIDKLFSAEVAFVYEGWSTHDQVIIRPQGIQLSALGMDSELGNIISVRNWKDTYSIRVGGEVDLFKPLLGIQAGYFYEPSALRDGTDGEPARLDASRIDLDKHGVSLGLSLAFYGFRLDVSGMYVQMLTTTITNSAVAMVAPLELPGGDRLLTTITNGTYSARLLIGSVKLSFALEDLLAASSD